MPTILKNKRITLEIDLPRENYQKARFDWSGKIASLKFNETPVFGVEKLDPSINVDFGKAFYNEFGIDTALGFDDANIGEGFHKIGVGVLKKTDEEYSFTKEYDISPCDFKTEMQGNSYIINCVAPLVNGYAYELNKQITLLERGFKIDYQLKNAGNKTINTDEYCHNFLAIDNALIGEAYKISFPYDVTPDNFDDYLNPKEAVTFSKNTIGFKRTPENDLFFSNLTSSKTRQATWQLVNTQKGVGIRETGSFNTNKVNVWGCGHVVSPELFFKINLSPGQTIAWDRKYEVFTI